MPPKAPHQLLHIGNRKVAPAPSSSSTSLSDQDITSSSILGALKSGSSTPGKGLGHLPSISFGGQGKGLKGGFKGDLGKDEREEVGMGVEDGEGHHPRVTGMRRWRRVWEGKKTMVWRAQDKVNKRGVVVKVGRMQEPLIAQSLKNEYAMIQHVQLPNPVSTLVTAYTLTPIEGRGFAMVMEDVGGESVMEWLKKAPTAVQGGAWVLAGFTRAPCGGRGLGVGVGGGAGAGVAQTGTRTNSRTMMQDAALRLKNLQDVKLASGFSLGEAVEIGIKDLNPNNIIVCRGEKLTAQIIDFSISSHLSSQNAVVTIPEGTPSFMAPEQSGRFNRKLDFRTDLYSLGCTLYCILVNRRPFQDYEHDEIIPKAVSDAVCKLMEKAPENRYQSAFGILRDMTYIHKILREERAEEAYRILERMDLGRWDVSTTFEFPESLVGREEELERMLTHFRRTYEERQSGLLVVAGHSGIGKSMFVREIQKHMTGTRGMYLTGKCDQIQTRPLACFIECFEEALKKILAGSESELTLFRAKIPKRVRRHELLYQCLPDMETIVPPVVKCQLEQDPERSKREVSFRRTSSSITGDTTSLRRRELRDAGFSTIPEYSQGSYNLAQSQLHLNQAFSDLVSVFAMTEALASTSLSAPRSYSYMDSPTSLGKISMDKSGSHLNTDTNSSLCLFLDDLQWADLATLSLLEYMLVTARCKGVFVIVAYRDNEVVKGHPLLNTIETISKKSEAKVEAISLGPLKQETVARYIAETVKAENVEDVRDLADLVHWSAQGNPFHIKQLLTSLYEDKLFTVKTVQENSSATPDSKFSKISLVPDMQRIRESIKASDGIVELLEKKLCTLSQSTHNVLQYAAVMGASFSMPVIASALKCSIASVIPAMNEALSAGLISPLTPWSSRLLEGMDDEVLDRLSKIDCLKFRWIHDKMQQAAFGNILREEMLSIHLKIGTVLLEEVMIRSPTYSLETEADSIPQNERQAILEIADHFTRSSDPKFMETLQSSQRDDIAKVLFQAARLAFSTGSMDTAQRFFLSTIAFLSADGWTRKTEGEFYYMISYESHLRGLITSTLNKDTVVSITLFEDAMKGVKNNEDKARILIEESIRRSFVEPTRARKLLKKYSKEDVFSFPEASHPKDLLVLKILTQSMRLDSNITLQTGLYLIVYQFTMNIRHRSLPAGILTLSAALHVLRLLTTDDQKHIFGLISMLAEAYPKTPETITAQWGNYSSIVIYFEDYGKFIDVFYDLFYIGVKEAGEQASSNYCIFLWAIARLWRNQRLHLLQEESGRLAFALSFTNRGYFRLAVKWAGELIEGLTSSDLRLFKWTSTLQSDEVYIQIMAKPKKELPHAIFGSIISTWALFTRNFDEMSRIMDEIRPVRTSAISTTLENKQYPFFEGISSLAILLREKETEKSTRVLSNSKSKRLHRKLIQKSLKVIEGFAKTTPSTDLHRCYLLKAGIASLNGDKATAISLYSAAGEEAVRNDFLFEAGLAYELLGEHMIRERFPVDSYRGVLLRSFAYYEEWGAEALTADLGNPKQEQKIGGQEDPATYQFLATGTAIKTTDNCLNGTGAQDALDFGSLIKASHQISKQENLSSILRETLNVVLENSGAMRAVAFKAESIGSPEGGFEIMCEANVKNKLQLAEDGDLGLQNETSPMLDKKQEIELFIEEDVAEECVERSMALPEKLVTYAARCNKTLVFKDVMGTEFASDPYFKGTNVKSALCFSLRSQVGKSPGVLVYLEHPASGVFTEGRIQVLEILLKQAALDVEKAQTHEAVNKFVPSELLSLIGIKTITDAQLGDMVQRKYGAVVHVAMNDLGFTSISEKLTAKQNFEFVNSLLTVLVPKLEEHGLVIDKFIGDAIMALSASDSKNIEKSSENAVRAAIAMQHALGSYNATISKFRWGHLVRNIRIGVGIHTGTAMLGLVGSSGRLNVTTISDTVNTASRIESITKLYSATVLISEITHSHLPLPPPFQTRLVDEVILKGQTKPLKLYEVIDAEPDDHIRQRKLDTLGEHQMAMAKYRSGEVRLALGSFERILVDFPEDEVCAMMVDRCKWWLERELPVPWNPVWVMKEK
ncbi:hypothetical protein HDU67_004296 [Dinochytrium kinnereticum]|nr:hypothetical protein HDU67_004296 [Dinochytrium kinnereticum]